MEEKTPKKTTAPVQAVESTPVKNFLEARKVSVKPIAREGKWASIFEDDRPNDPFMFDTAKKSYPLPNKAGTLQKVSVLDAYEKVATMQYPNELITEQEFFERQLFKKPGDLSVYNNESQFWKEFRVMIPKTGITLDLKDPIDMLKYKVLLACRNHIAPNWESRLMKAGYEFVIIDEGTKVSAEKEKGEVEDAATLEYLKIKDSAEKLKDVLRLQGFVTSENFRLDALQNEVRRFAKNTPKAFLDIIKDPLFEEKILIKNALKVKALETPKPGQYALPGGVILGSERETITYLNDPENFAIRQRIINQIENTK